MLKSLVHTNAYKQLKYELANPSHAYLFFSPDAVLNEEIARLFAMAIHCKKDEPCFNCESCKRSIIDKNPDLTIIDKTTMQVADINKIIEDENLSPMIEDKKIVIFLHADGMNEIAQNKFLKSLEEPSKSVIYILCCKDINKLLPTIISRTKKYYLSNENTEELITEFSFKFPKASEIAGEDLTLEEKQNFATNEDYKDAINLVCKVVLGINSTQDIAKVVCGTVWEGVDKKTFLSLLSKLFNIALKNGNSKMFDEKVIEYINKNYSKKAIIRAIKLIETAYTRLTNNVNFNYILDTMFYNILKERFLCKQ